MKYEGSASGEGLHQWLNTCTLHQWLNSCTLHQQNRLIKTVILKATLISSKCCTVGMWQDHSSCRWFVEVNTSGPSSMEECCSGDLTARVYWYRHLKAQCSPPFIGSTDTETFFVNFHWWIVNVFVNEYCPAWMSCHWIFLEKKAIERIHTGYFYCLWKHYIRTAFKHCGLWP